MVKLYLVLAVVANMALLGESTFPACSIPIESCQNPVPKYNRPRRPSVPVTRPNNRDIDNRLQQAIWRLTIQSLQQRSREYPRNNLVVSLIPTYLKISQLALYTKLQILHEMFAFLNVRNRNEIFYTIRKLLAELNKQNSKITAGNCFEFYISMCDSFNNDFRLSLYRNLNGKTGIIDCSKPHNQQSQCVPNGYINTDKICKGSAIALTSRLTLSLTLHQFTFFGLVEIYFYRSSDCYRNSRRHVSIKKMAWTGNGRAKYAFNEKLNSKIYIINTPNGYLIIIHPKDRTSECLNEVLAKIADSECCKNVLSKPYTETCLELIIPLNKTYSQVIDHGQNRNSLTKITKPSFNGFGGILKEKSGYVSQMSSEVCVTIEGLPASCEVSPYPNFGSACPKGIKRMRATINSPFLVLYLNKEGTVIAAITETGN